MGRLANPRHERIAQAFHKLGCARHAYLAAGYKAAGPRAPGLASPRDTNASRLLKNAQVKTRLSEIAAMAANRHQITVDSLLADLESDRQLAHREGQSGGAVGATMAKARLLGLVIDRKESGQPGEFANLQSVQEVIAAVRRDLGDDMAAALERILVQSEQVRPDLPESDTAH